MKDLIISEVNCLVYAKLGNKSEEQGGTQMCIEDGSINHFTNIEDIKRSKPILLESFFLRVAT